MARRPIGQLFNRFRWRLQRAAQVHTPVHIGTAPREEQHQLAPTAPGSYSPALAPLPQTDEQQAHNAAIDRRWAEERERRIVGLRDGSYRPQFLAFDAVVRLQETCPQLWQEGRLVWPDRPLTDEEITELVACGAVEVGMGFGMRTHTVNTFTSPQPALTAVDASHVQEVIALRRSLAEASRALGEPFSPEAVLAAAGGDPARAKALQAKLDALFGAKT